MVSNGLDRVTVAVWVVGMEQECHARATYASGLIRQDCAHLPVDSVALAWHHSLMTKGQELTATLRKSFAMNTRTRMIRRGVNLRTEMMEAIVNACYYPGYYTEAKTAIYRNGFGAVQAYDKHVDGYRIDGTLRFRITSMSPWEFAGLLGDMVDSGVENTGTGETYFAQMRQAA